MPITPAGAEQYPADELCRMSLIVVVSALGLEPRTY